MIERTLRTTFLSAMLALAACGGDADADEAIREFDEGFDDDDPAAAAAGHEGHEGHAAPSGPAPLPAVPEGARIFFVAPSAGEVRGPLVDGKVAVQVRMGAEGVEVEPAGTIRAGAGHHHILIDAEVVPSGTVVPADETHIHFGGGQTEATVPLAPGAHTLRLQFADGSHRSYGAALSAEVAITVVEGEAAAAPAEEAAAEGEAEAAE